MISSFYPQNTEKMKQSSSLTAKAVDKWLIQAINNASTLSTFYIDSETLKNIFNEISPNEAVNKLHIFTRLVKSAIVRNIELNIINVLSKDECRRFPKRQTYFMFDSDMNESGFPHTIADSNDQRIEFLKNTKYPPLQVSDNFNNSDNLSDKDTIIVPKSTTTNTSYNTASTSSTNITTDIISVKIQNIHYW